MKRAKLPLLDIRNQTAWYTPDLRKIVRAAMRAVGSRQRKTVEFNPSGRKGEWVSGRAHYGTRTREGIRVWICLPKKTTAAEVAATVAHELLHSLGARHADMTPEQRNCTAWTGDPPEWVRKLVLRRRDEVAAKKPKKPETPAERGERLRKERAAHARAMHRKSETRLKRARTLEKKWRERVRYYDRTERLAARSDTGPRCDACGRRLTETDRELYVANGAPAGEWPACCEDCAEMAVVDALEGRKDSATGEPLPSCGQCGRKLTKRERDVYARNGALTGGWTLYCDDCVEKGVPEEEGDLATGERPSSS